MVYIIPTRTCEISTYRNTSSAVCAHNVAISLCKQSKACSIAEYVVINISDEIIVYRRLAGGYRSVKILR